MISCHHYYFTIIIITLFPVSQLLLLLYFLFHNYYYYCNYYYHCRIDWKEDKKLVKEFQTKCKKVWGLSKLRMEDQERVQKLMNVNGGSSGGGSSGGNIVSPEDLAASSSPEQVQKRKEFEEENKKIWQIKDELKRLKLSSLREMLSENGQSEKGGEDLLIERCALGMMFGCLPECPNEKCQDGYMTFSGGKFKCKCI